MKDLSFLTDHYNEGIERINAIGAPINFVTSPMPTTAPMSMPFLWASSPVPTGSMPPIIFSPSSIFSTAARAFSA